MPIHRRPVSPFAGHRMDARHEPAVISVVTTLDDNHNAHSGELYPAVAAHQVVAYLNQQVRAGQ